MNETGAGEGENSPFRFDNSTLALLGAIGAIGFSTNVASLRHIIKTFSLKKSVYLPILFDAAINVLGFLTLCFTVLGFVAIPEIAYGKLGCTLMFLTSFAPSNLGPFFISQISVIRVLIVRKNFQDVETRDKVYLKWVIILLVCAILHLSVYCIICYYTDTPFGLTEQVCRFGKDGKSLGKLIFIMFIFPNIFCSIMAITFDSLTLVHLKNRALSVAPANANSAVESSSGANSNNNGAKDRVLDIPIRSTIMSTALAINYLILGGVSSNESIALVTRVYILNFGAHFVSLIRNPLIVASIFKSNQMNEAISREADRARRQQMEVQHALSVRNGRKSNGLPQNEASSSQKY